MLTQLSRPIASPFTSHSLDAHDDDEEMNQIDEIYKGNNMSVMSWERQAGDREKDLPEKIGS